MLKQEAYFYSPVGGGSGGISTEGFISGAKPVGNAVLGEMTGP